MDHLVTWCFDTRLMSTYTVCMYKGSLIHFFFKDLQHLYTTKAFHYFAASGLPQVEADQKMLCKSNKASWKDKSLLPQYVLANESRLSRHNGMYEELSVGKQTNSVAHIKITLHQLLIIKSCKTTGRNGYINSMHCLCWASTLKLLCTIPSYPISWTVLS